MKKNFKISIMLSAALMLVGCGESEVLIEKDEAVNKFKTALEGLKSLHAINAKTSYYTYESEEWYNDNDIYLNIDTAERDDNIVIDDEAGYIGSGTAHIIEEFGSNEEGTVEDTEDYYAEYYLDHEYYYQHSYLADGVENEEYPWYLAQSVYFFFGNIEFDIDWYFGNYISDDEEINKNTISKIISVLPTPTITKKGKNETITFNVTFEDYKKFVFAFPEEHNIYSPDDSEEEKAEKLEEIMFRFDEGVFQLNAFNFSFSIYDNILLSGFSFEFDVLSYIADVDMTTKEIDYSGEVIKKADIETTISALSDDYQVTYPDNLDEWIKNSKYGVD